MRELGPNVDGELLEPGRVPDCYLGLRLDASDDAEPAGVLVVGRRRCYTLVSRSRTGRCCMSL